MALMEFIKERFSSQVYSTIAFFFFVEKMYRPTLG